MNDPGAFERIVIDGLASIGMPAPSDDALQRTITRASRTRQRPGWLARIKEPPMRISSHLAVGSPTARVAAIAVATLLLTVVVAGAGLAGSRLLAADASLVVDQAGGGDFTTITEAVAAAHAGDTVLVRPGTYIEAVTVDKDILLTGDGPREQIVITAPLQAPAPVVGKAGEEHETFALHLQGSDAVVSDLTVRGEPSIIVVRGGTPTLEHLLVDGSGVAGAAPDERSAGSSIIVADGSDAVLRDNELVSGGPIAVYDGSTPLIAGNHLSAGPHIWGEFGEATVIRGNTIDHSMGYYPSIFIWDAPGLLVEDNTITDPTGDGIAINTGSATLRDNTISGGTTAINTRRPGPGTTITDNAIEDTKGFGVWVTLGAPTVEGNTVSRAGIGGIGIAGGAANVSGNVLRDNQIGIHWSAPTEGAIMDNEVSGGVQGVLIEAGSPNVTGNDIEGVEDRGLFVAGGATPTLGDNHSCGNGQNLVLADGSDMSIDDSNVICED